MKTRVTILFSTSAFGLIAAASCGGDLDLTGPEAARDATAPHQASLVGVDCGSEPAPANEPCGTEGSICGWTVTDDGSAQSVYQ